MPEFFHFYSEVKSIRRLARTAWAASLAIGSILLAPLGCASIGTATIRPDRFHYNDAGAESNKEQLLLNLVRLRFGEPIYFVEITSMLSQLTLSAGGSISGWHNDIHGAYGPAIRAAYGLRGDASRETTVGGNLQYSDSPTISYRPLQGEEFAKRVLAPIAPAVVIYLSHSGWSVDRLLVCCVQQLNDIPNRALQSTENETALEAKSFNRLASLLKRLQDHGGCKFSIELDNGISKVILRVPATIPGMDAELKEAREILGYPAEGELTLRVVSGSVKRAPDELVMQTRSVLAVMHALAEECEIPPHDIQSHEDSEPRLSTGNESAGKWLSVQSSRLPHVDSFAQIYYNGCWFYISNSDWSSKRTIALLLYLFSLQESDIPGGTPLVTVQAGR